MVSDRQIGMLLRQSWGNVLCKGPVLVTETYFTSWAQEHPPAGIQIRDPPSSTASRARRIDALPEQNHPSMSAEIVRGMIMFKSQLTAEDDVTSADKLSLDVDLRDSRPLAVLLNSLSELLISETVEALHLLWGDSLWSDTSD